MDFHINNIKVVIIHSKHVRPLTTLSYLKSPQVGKHSQKQLLQPETSPKKRTLNIPKKHGATRPSVSEESNQTKNRKRRLLLHWVHWNILDMSMNILKYIRTTICLSVRLCCLSLIVLQGRYHFVASGSSCYLRFSLRGSKQKLLLIISERDAFHAAGFQRKKATTKDLYLPLMSARNRNF